MPGLTGLSGLAGLSGVAGSGADAPVPDVTPNFQGGGACTNGGAGGSILTVTNLNDSGAGSLRAALEASGPRIINVEVDGYIDLADSIKIRNPFLTFNGDTSGGKGICTKDNRITIQTHDVIMRYFRSRPGDDIGAANPDTMDAMDMFQTSLPSDDRKVFNIMLDHCTFGWAIDGNCDIANSDGTFAIRNVTVQWCIIDSCLNNSLHSEGVHSTGALIPNSNAGTENITFHHNLFVSNVSRQPLMRTETVGEFINNVIFNGGNSVLGEEDGGPANINYINNVNQMAPNTGAGDMARIDLILGCADQENEVLHQIYESGNIDKNGDTGWSNIMSCDFGDDNPASTRFQTLTPFVNDCEPVQFEDVSELIDVLVNGTGYDHNGVGVSHDRDAREQAVLDELIVARDQGSGAVDTNVIRIVDTPADVGGYPALT